LLGLFDAYLIISGCTESTVKIAHGHFEAKKDNRQMSHKKFV
jgi:hypothetical protein